MNNLPIGMFDSGIGGLMLFSQIECLLPNETIYYLADTAHFPYGDKSQSEIIQYSLQNAAFLLEQNIKALVIACFTASALAYEALLSYTSLPVISVVDSLIEELERRESSSHVAILGTKGTINSAVIQNRLSPDLTLFPMACPELIQSIERRDEAASKAYLEEYNEYFARHKVDTVLLACTHFAHILPLMKESFGKDIDIIEASASAAAKIASSVGLSGVKSPHRLFTTGDPALFQTQLGYQAELIHR